VATDPFVVSAGAPFARRSSEPEERRNRIGSSRTEGGGGARGFRRIHRRVPNSDDLAVTVIQHLTTAPVASFDANETRSAISLRVADAARDERHTRAPRKERVKKARAAGSGE
jgi:hypothetical protein